MRWIVGLEFGPVDEGALALAGWINHCAADTMFLAQHTVEWALRTLDPEIADQTNAGAHARAREAFGRVGIDEVEVTVIPERRPEVNLAASAVRHDFDAIVVGRRARSDQLHVVRLGAVARRLLRTLPRPVIVAPSELGAAGIREGPVILAVDGETPADASLAFAERFAGSVGREVAVAHVFPSPTALTAPYVPKAYWARIREEARAAEEERLQAQLAALHVEDARLLRGEGPAVAELRRIAQDERACLVVTSSRQLTTTARIFESSVCSALAASATVAVAVVPATSS